MKKIKNLFSERKKLIKVENSIQVNSISIESKNIIWSLLSENIFSHVQSKLGNMYDKTNYFFPLAENIWIKNFFKYFWLRIEKRPIDELESDWNRFYNLIRNRFFGSKWDFIYTFIEIVFKTIEGEDLINHIRLRLNEAFEDENIPYRIIGSLVTDITDQEEIDSLNEALQSPFGGVEEHFSRAMELLYSKSSPDYRNSIKESISAVEAICKIIANSEKATLSDALRIISKKHKIHQSLESGLNKIYGYSSDEKGIRHALLDESQIDFAEAKFMLVSCSAFYNYIKLLSI
ncbi:AbiJ-NTD4 domain-containing protein [Leptospira haakeii]|uniref:HEPN AbiJ-N-terminal domain-containing protein n=1 Tax=Leptospira haakeii TaxID=2023198 RepID=A0ABX4PLD0_9LEPT|nr:hypothetical protein [Leptospira haakeii]PKA16141.1 hypothetical protein CH363_08310 [Leptospira haakeii]PKA18089.1 hypothetical protein CH377_19500 [Leptospira haakeii]